MNKISWGQLYHVAALISIISLTACSTDNDPAEPSTGQFDRKPMLQFWAQSIITPRYEAYEQSLKQLHQDAQKFTSSTDEVHLKSLRESFAKSYLAWQKVAMLTIPAAEAQSLRNYSNVFPTDTTLIQQHIQSGSYDLSLPSTLDAQGFPALDFLIHGKNSNTATLHYYQNTAKAKLYLTELSARLQRLTAAVLNQWKNGGKASFIAQDGASATASVNLFVNDFIFYYERLLRAGKVGIPAGVFSGGKRPGAVEGVYSGPLSRKLLKEALQGTVDFFAGRSAADTTSIEYGPSLATYLDSLDVRREGTLLSDVILDQWTTAQGEVDQLDANLQRSVVTNNTQMLQTYDALQKNVIYLKVDMLQALNIRVDYIDADGD